MLIEIEDIAKEFGPTTALYPVSLSIPSGALVALLGPSGSGKTTLLRILGGLEFPTQGRVRFDGLDATGLSVQERRAGFVFQHYALFRHMTVFENIAYGLRARPRRVRPTGPEIERRVTRLLRLIQLPDSWPGRWRSSRGCCCSTSRSARSTPGSARSFAPGCGRSTFRPA